VIGPLGFPSTYCDWTAFSPSGFCWPSPPAGQGSVIRCVAVESSSMIKTVECATAEEFLDGNEPGPGSGVEAD
jgi:hypothetical protein